MKLKRTLPYLVMGAISFGAQAYTEEELIELSALFMQAVDQSPNTMRLSSTSNISSFSTTNDNSLKLMTELALSRMEVKEQITPETTALFGDRVDLNTGSVSFQHIDVALKGNNALPVQIMRTYRGSKNNRGNNASFGDWVLDIPSITTTTLEYQPGLLSFIPDCLTSTPRWVDTGFATVGAMQYWSGTSLDIPGVTHQKLTNLSNGALPNNWKVSCLPNRYGFQAVSPEGVTYTFDVVRLVPSTLVPVAQESEIWNPNYNVIELMRTYTLNIQVSQIKDRFNNTVNFEYQSATLPYGSSSQYQRQVQ